MNKTVAIGAVVLTSLGGFLAWRSSKGPVTAPTAAQWQAAMSNNAVVYFRAGVACGVYVERAKPGLVPAALHKTSRDYFASLGQDPYLSPREGRVEKAERESVQMFKPKPEVPEPSTNSPSTNSAYSISSTNGTNAEVKP